MKSLRIIGLSIVAIAVAAALLSFQAASGRGQSQKPSKSEIARPAALVTDVSVASADKPATPLSEAATRNAMLENELVWTFGGKQQRGWYLYDLLIGETVSAKGAPASDDFAASISTWQRKAGIATNGVLDEDSFMAMVAEWQSKRLKDRTPAEPDQLLTAPVSDFYDPERKEELRQVERATYAAYKRMLAAAIADPSLHLAHTSPEELAAGEKFFKIVSAFRSREYQEKLRRESPNAGSAGLAVNSPHFTGRALDLYVGGDPVDTNDANRAIQVKTPVYQWLVHNAERFGFRPYFYEPWHWEYVK